MAVTGPTRTSDDAPTSVHRESTRVLPRPHERDAPDDDDAPTKPELARTTGPLATGTLIGRYLVLRHIGAGGLGDVYAAYDTELERKVAIKLLRAVGEHATPAWYGDRRARVLREAHAIARLRHPNVVTVYDVGDHGDDMFLALELLEGITVDAWLRQKPRSWQAIRDVFVEAGRGLAAAHHAGVIHRDFKPSNVIVGDDGRVTVLDFGLARAVVDDDTTPPRAEHEDTPLLLRKELTDEGVTLGTPQYMAPELWQQQPASPSSDEFAFCVALFRSLHGALPFEGQTIASYRASTTVGELVRTQQRGVPPWLDRAIARGLRPQPADRHGSIDALLDAMVLDRRRRRRRLLALSIAVPLVSAAAVAGAWMLRPTPAATAPDRTRTLVDEARTAAAHGQYVHPSPGSPDEPTAIAKVLELEALGDDDATAQAAALRSELADALVSLGDRYFERPGGPPFAVDFYAAALVFDPQREHARTRVTLSPGQLAELVAKAEHGGFTPAELVAAEPLSLLAEADPQRRAQKVERYFASRDDAAESTRARLDGLLDTADRELARAASTRTIIAAKLSNEARTDDRPSAPVPATTTVESKAPTDVREPSDAREPGDGARDPAGAAREAAAGTKALRSGQLGLASSAFHRALQLDRRNAAALGGLAELHFERSEYRDAERFAARATAVTPRASALWILLGDARVKLLRYDAARAAYDKANALGASSAQSRILRLDRLVGK